MRLFFETKTETKTKIEKGKVPAERAWNGYLRLSVCLFQSRAVKTSKTTREAFSGPAVGAENRAELKI